MKKQTSDILRKIAQHEDWSYRKLKKHYNTLSHKQRTDILIEGRKQIVHNKISG